ncbi:serine/threonine protein kinase [Leptolyngbyaceae cyanobacterium CCMR0082]|uniref:Serine/threonine protein kinase n=1 Tax=Adonisia turfae CCMR0082 TaxID=2304604 RepID=A0A6M0S5Z0_9CYAN|nr:serine/threonine-protein kinase [Adonisia turfae]NEZ63401.1 serine/threonine protein kinase [Adonisia turfae CCMR0082]
MSHQRSSYRLLGLVGNGQFGRVYCGVHRKTGQLVAIKYLHRHSLSTHAFLRELHCLLSLSHPHIVACHALEHCEDGRRLVLEYCAGGTLRSHMLSPLSVADILTLVSDVLSGLAHAHQQGIIHCDIKPENILLSYSDGRWRAKISDFGIAKLTQDQQNHEGTGQTGSPAYMAPERFYRQYSPSADVYAVGVMLFELLVGQRPFTGTPMALQSAHLNQPVPDADQLSEPLKHIIAKALEKLPARRYPTAAEMLVDLKQLDPSSLNLGQSLNAPKIDYVSYTGNPLHRLTQPVTHFQKLSAASITQDDESAVESTMLMVHGLQLATLQQQSLNVSPQILDASVQGLHLSPAGLMVSTAYTLWRGATPECLTSLSHWPLPAMAAVAPHQRWIATVSPSTKQLTITQLREPTQTPVRRPLPPDIEIHQVVAIDKAHIGILASSAGSGSQLMLWNRRGMYLTSLDLGITLQQLTPTDQRHQWMAIDVHAPHTVVFLTLKPLRMTRMILDICPALMLDLPWGYLFSNTVGRMLLLDRDFYPIGGIQGPAGVTALTAMSAHELLVATWQNKPIGLGALHRLNLQEFDLDMIF